jgi:pilus assembly protein Flp/PilA
MRLTVSLLKGLDLMSRRRRDYAPNTMRERPGMVGRTSPREKRTMKNFATSIVNFLKEEDGPTAVEYAVMLALIVVVCLTAITSVGTAASAKFAAVATAISN